MSETVIKIAKEMIGNSILIILVLLPVLLIILASQYLPKGWERKCKDF